MLIEKYDLEVFTPPCDPGAERYAARARLTVDISEALPYLNSTLRGAFYFPGAKALTWKNSGHNNAFRAYEIATSNIEDRAGAEQEIKALIDLVNRTWEHRDEITPDHSVRQRPTPMAIYKLLPNTNCKQCEEPTCYSFALKLVASHSKLSDCPPLFEPQYADNLTALEEIIIEAPAEG
jgi:ArsR family metal-binding transcriptional regulator